MGKQYHCEYCNKVFADNLGNRKRHLKSNAHQQQRRLHYAALKDPAVILEEEFQKKPCHNFQKGHCHFGELCIYSHMTPQRIQELQNKVFQKQQSLAEKEKIIKREQTGEEILSDWLTKHGLSQNKPVASQEVVQPNQLPPMFEGRIALPQSILVANLPAEACDSNWG